MNEDKRRFILTGLKLFDISQLVLAYGLATVLVVQFDQRVSLQQFLSMRVKLSNCIAFASILLTWHTIFFLCGLYRSKRLSPRQSEIVDLLKAVTLSTVLLGAISALLRIVMITPIFLLYFWLLISFLLISSRLTIRPILANLRRHGRNLRNMLIVGTNTRAIEFARKLEKRPELGYRLLGFVDDDWPGIGEFNQQVSLFYPIVRALPSF